MDGLINFDAIFVIAGGPSVNGLDLSLLGSYGYKLGVNDSFVHTRCDGVFSMDGRWMFNRAGLLKKAGLQCFFSKKHFNKWIGIDNAWPNTHLYKVDPYQKGLSNTWDLHGDNSGFGALNLAYMAKPKQIYLLGFDLTKSAAGDEHWYGDYEWRVCRHGNHFFERWHENHELAAAQFKAAGIEVYNVSSISKLKVYPKIKYDEIADNIRRLRTA